ncbi:protein of unknown function [Methylorubrum extorquens DM4]|uniref:Uncharacterized protein n=1 Tax=Methylorubrum extorquens (strain DSM 6343 / CIP 106787 / DM4) TaxID=661410 RepID=C7CCE1_METED|nr:hypothetical protein [Methylorubrum extorquens]CAX22487.1 protein of unknown function [Methylorubrum extorquens DM4]
MHPPFDLARLRARFPSGYVDSARRATLTSAVVCHGLTEDDLGQQSFCSEMSARREWADANCRCDYVVEPIRDRQSRLVGRVFRFADANEAFAFKMRF